MKHIAILGFGTVGGGVADIITDSADLIASSVGEPLALKRILDLRDFPGNRFESLLTKSFEDILNDQDITIVVECLGGKTFAYDYTKRLLAAGKSVITSTRTLLPPTVPSFWRLPFKTMPIICLKPASAVVFPLSAP